ncbi:hypothetical protein GCM10022199_00020 [Marihabitans asiaticum]|uniref:Uncharacterized protein n=1 Tax=Marihabitans asiaticum TaxID=415218 RepID=A0A560WGV6_9MICO|nr:hypothetical protein [Marihabitans asiaticum]TWD16715.1 hypothetical protein FB557_0248 [Marihabitans asiaticum]
MAHYEICPQSGIPLTNHSEEIAELRWRADRPGIGELEAAAFQAAVDLLECHDATGISLDDWEGPASLVNLMLRGRFLPNYV